MPEPCLEALMRDAASDRHIADGFGAAEGGHRWSIGRTATFSIPVKSVGEPHVMILDVAPWLHPPTVTMQRVMIGVNGRLNTTIAVTHDMAIGLDSTAEQTASGRIEISLDHLDSETSRQYDAYHNGQSLCFMVLSVRLFAFAIGLQSVADYFGPITPNLLR